MAVNNQLNPTMVKIHLRQSKTDQFGKGCDVVLGRTNAKLCPVAAVLGFLSRRGNQPGAFFVDSKSNPVIKSQFIRDLRAIFGALGILQNYYAGQCFCIGAATSAALAGVEDQALGQWQSTAFLRYIRMLQEKLHT